MMPDALCHISSGTQFETQCMMTHKGNLYISNVLLGVTLVSGAQICIKYSPDAVPPIHDESYHVATDKDPPFAILAASSAGLFLATIYNQSQLAERKHVACYWLILAVPVSAQPPLLVITTKLAAAILVVAVVSS